MPIRWMRRTTDAFEDASLKEVTHPLLSHLVLKCLPLDEPKLPSRISRLKNSTTKGLLNCNSLSGDTYIFYSWKLGYAFISLSHSVTVCSACMCVLPFQAV